MYIVSYTALKELAMSSVTSVFVQLLSSLPGATSHTRAEIVAIVFIWSPAQSLEQSISSIEHIRMSGLENPRDWGVWWAAVYGVAQSGT